MDVPIIPTAYAHGYVPTEEDIIIQTADKTEFFVVTGLATILLIVLICLFVFTFLRKR